MKTLGLNGLGPGSDLKRALPGASFNWRGILLPSDSPERSPEDMERDQISFFFSPGRDTLTHSARADVDRGGRVFFAALRRHAELWRLRPKAENGPWTRSSPRRRSIITFHPFINNRPVSVMNFSLTAIFQPLLEC